MKTISIAITLALITALLSCQKAELAPTDYRCQMIDPYTNQRCQNESTMIVDDLRLCDQHYQLKYTPTTTNTDQNNQETDYSTGYNTSYNTSYNCQNSYAVTCGARTKKGTSCKNRTRSCNGRCYLHGG